MNFLYNDAIELVTAGGLNWGTADLRLLLVSTNTTAHLDFGAEFLTGGTGFTVLDEFNGSGYTRQALASVTVTLDPITRDFVLSCATIDFGATVGNGSRQIKAAVMYLNAGSDAARKPLAYFDSVEAGWEFPYSPAGGPVRITPSAEGLLRFRSRTP